MPHQRVALSMCAALCLRILAVPVGITTGSAGVEARVAGPHIAVRIEAWLARITRLVCRRAQARQIKRVTQLKVSAARRLIPAVQNGFQKSRTLHAVMIGIRVKAS